ncbi:sensor histidine kinase [Urechidicola vernalis]|uniref:Histidine kinase n=1 Tax=Urechidicola vernalis TaxID=3075600 RepID=A0ABU2Y169_9FLAO|nr:histidine kinase [Urechidicola sp. P050]MDT0551944.1 histidine kinase [Urechidicola sp. P050]
MNIKQVKQTVIIRAAIIVSLLISVPRVLSFYDITDQISDDLVSISPKDIGLRFLAILIFSWVLLQFNTNTRFIYNKTSLLFRWVVTILINIVLWFVAVKILLYVYPLLIGQTIEGLEADLFYIIYFVVVLVLFFLSGILRYQIIHREDTIEKELLKQQSLENELTALRNQINPHFLFNSLNSLNSLVRENDDATQFINKLSFMYRYILQSSDRNMVTLKEELKFLDSYIYLIKTRYRERFFIEINIDDSLLSKCIPPLGLQVLVENAVKHNEISASNPLTVNVYTDNGFICVENEIRPRLTLAEGTGNGLSNLDKRLFLLKKQHITISDTDNVFKVKYSLN